MLVLYICNRRNIHIGSTDFTWDLTVFVCLFFYFCCCWDFNVLFAFFYLQLTMYLPLSSTEIKTRKENDIINNVMEHCIEQRHKIQLESFLQNAHIANAWNSTEHKLFISITCQIANILTTGVIEYWGSFSVAIALKYIENKSFFQHSYNNVHYTMPDT